MTGKWTVTWETPGQGKGFVTIDARDEDQARTDAIRLSQTPTGGRVVVITSPAGEPSRYLDGQPWTIPAHLVNQVSDRGMVRLPDVPLIWGGEVRGAITVHTSSAASGANVWITGRPDDEPTCGMHLAAADALRHADQVVEIIRTHYQLAGEVPDLDQLAGAAHAAMLALIQAVAVHEGETPATVPA